MAKIQKLGLLSDIHNDLDGLHRALEVLSDCDKIMHLGDLVEDTAEGNDIVETLIAAGVEGVIGYHDELALQISRTFNQQTIDYLTNLPKELQKGDFLLVHDNPLSKEKNRGLTNSGGYIKDTISAQKVFDEASFRVLLVGHSHKAEQYEFDGVDVTKTGEETIILDTGKRYILNPGPVCVQQRGTEPSVGVFDFTKSQYIVRRL